MKDAHGNYIETPAEQQKALGDAAEEQKPTDPVETGDRMPMADKQAEQLFGDIGQAVEASGMKMETLLAQAVATDGIPPALSEIARSRGISPDQLQADYQRIVGALSAQADGIITAEGLDPAEVWQWMNSFYPKSKVTGMHFRHAYLGEVKGYREVAKAFRAAKGGGSLSNAKLPPGAKVGRSPSGIPTVSIPGFPAMSMDNAKRMGLI
jgi:hypothetical protein